MPNDILRRIAFDFPKEAEASEVTALIGGLWKEPLNVGAEQLARSILYLASGDLAELRTLCADKMGDPRDVIAAAGRLAGDPRLYFIEPFDLR